MTEYQCKICWDTSSLNHLISPCACTGTMRFVHPACLTEWLYQRGDNVPCEVCKRPINFKMPLHQDITLIVICIWIYILVIVYGPFIYMYYKSVGGWGINA